MAGQTYGTCIRRPALEVKIYNNTIPSESSANTHSEEYVFEKTYPGNFGSRKDAPMGMVPYLVGARQSVWLWEGKSVLTMLTAGQCWEDRLDGLGSSPA